MTISANDPQQQLYRAWEESLEQASVCEATFESGRIRFVLGDGRELTVPLSWFPRLEHASKPERENYEIIAEGTIIEWPDLDDGVEVAHLLLGWQSGEDEASLKRWLDERASRKAS